MKVLGFFAVSLFVAASPAASADRSAEARLETPTGVLHGTELVPAGEGPFPVVLLIAGSGPTDRDGNSPLLPGKNESLRMLAEGLARNGVASLRYDKRGIGASAKAGVREEDLRFEHLVDDAARWVWQLEKDARYDRVVVAGHSEGSLIGMLAAKQATPDAFVSIAGIARSGADVIRDQLKGKLLPQLAADSERVLAALVAGRTVDDPPAELAALYRPSVQPYLVSWFRHVPAEIVGTLEMPVLIVQGTHDLQVTVEEAQALAKAKPDAKLVLLEGMNHVLKATPADPSAQIGSYSDPSLPVVPALVDAIASFTKSAPRRAEPR